LQSGAAGHPFVGPGAYRQPCRTAWPLGCDKDMATSQHLTTPAPPLGHYDIDTASFRTGNVLRDHRVRSAGFLDARRFPAISFTDGRISADGATITGTLTVRNQARPVTLSLGEVEADGQSFTASATVRIDRINFGVTTSPGLAGRYLDLSVQVRCVQNSWKAANAHV